MFIFGSFGRDVLTGSDRRDWVFGLWGRDIIHGGGGNDALFGGGGRDVINAGSGSDYVFGGSGSDTIDAGSGSDVVYGGSGRDTFIHNVSDNVGSRDYYSGGRGKDTLELVLTQAQANDTTLLAEIAAFNTRPRYQKNWDFTFTSLGVTVNSIEFLKFTVVDTGNSAPVTPPLVEAINEDALTGAFDLLAGATDADGDALSVVDLVDTLTTRDGRVLTKGADYTLVSGARFITLTAAGLAKFNDLADGEADQVIVRFGVSDGTDSVANTLTLTIAGANDSAALSGDVTGAVLEDATLSASGTLMVVDPDAGQNTVVPQSGQAGTYGVFSITADGVWTYVLDNDSAVVQALGDNEVVVESFTVVSSDGTAETVVEITVAGAFDAPPNTAPIAMNDTFDGTEDIVISGNVLANDNDPDGDTLTATLVEGPTEGTLDWDGTGAFSYTPVANSNGAVSFSYKVSDGELESDIAVVNLNFAAVNDDPVIGSALSLVAAEDSAVKTIDLLDTAFDVDTGDVLSIANISGLPVSLTLDGTTLRIDPADTAFQSLGADAEAVRTVTYDVVDGNGGSTQQTVNITVTGVNDDPDVAGALTLNATEGGAVQTIDLLNGASDIDIGDTLSIQNVVGLSPGISLDGTTLRIDPNDAFYDALNDGETVENTVSYDIVDGKGGVVNQTISISVDGVTDAIPPDAPTLTIAASDASAAGQTQSARVTLVGQTSPGVVVSLFAADSTDPIIEVLSDSNGAFRIPNVSLTVGTSEFRVVALDPVTGLENETANVAFDRVEQPVDAPANAVLHWIDIALETIADSSTTPDYASRSLAMQSIAVENVLAAVNDESGYLFSFDDSGANANLAIAHAAHSVLSGLYAGQVRALDDKLQSYVDGASAGVDPASLAASETLGATVAAKILGFRADDGWDDNEIFIGADEDGAWRPTGPRYLNAQNPQWANLDPFTLETTEQFRPDAPPSLLDDTITDDIYANDLERVRALGAFDSEDRTFDQTQIARFWADGSGTQTPPGHWNRIAAQVGQEEGLSLSQSAELMLKLNLALADAAVAASDTKYAYDFWRPVTVLRQGGTDDGTVIAADNGWASLLLTPAHPEYVSGHSTYSGAAATILTDAFGDGYAFSDTATTTSGDITRDFDSFWDAANEAGESRIFGGIHFDFSNETGLDLGTDVANWVLQSFDPLTDTVAPTITLTGLDADAVGAPPVISGVLTDNLSGAIDLRANLDTALDYVPVSVDALGGFSFDVGALDDGLHAVSFVARDAAGNIGTKSYEFFLSTADPVVTLDAQSISGSNSALEADSRITGDIGLPPGVDIAALSVQIDGGLIRPLGFEADGSFDALLQIGALDAGAHEIVLRVVDTAGNATVTTIATTLDARPPFQITDLSPNDRETEVGATVHPLVQFNRAVDVTTLTEDSFYAITATGVKVAATIVPLNDNTGAWMFFDEPLPGATAIELILDGSLIQAADGAFLDADADGVDGGQAVHRFTTVALEGLETTTLVGRVVDPGDDLYMMTPDDFVSGPAGVTDYENHTYRNPIEGAEVYVLGRPDLKVLTDENGAFELTGLPTGKVKIVVEGRTATNAPDDFYWPEMVLDVEIRPGQENTILGGMGPLEAQLERQDDDAFYLPRVPTAALSDVSDSEVTIITPVSAAGTNLTPEQFALISLEVQPNSMVDGQGNVIENPQLGLVLVPSEMVIDMLPDGVPTPPIFLTIQGPDGGVFTQEAILTIPNVFGLAPGEKTEFFSYDHQTGLLVINGVGTVSEDGTYIQTDPGSGILQPGWNGPVRISRVVIDPQLPCPPGTNHPNNDDPNNVTTTDILDVTNTLVGNKGAIENLAEIIGKGDLAGKPTKEGALGNALALRDDSIRSQNTLDIMANAWYADDPGPLGGEVDAGFWGIMGLQLAGDVSRTAVHGFSALVQNIPGLEEFRPVSKTLDTFIAGADVVGQVTSGQNPLEPVTRLVEKVQDKSTDTAQNGISGKFGPGTPKAQEFQDFSDDADEKLLRLQELEDQLVELSEAAEELKAAAEDLDRINDEIIDDIRENGNKPSPEAAERLFGTEGSDPADSEFGQAMEAFIEASLRANDIGNYDSILFEIYGILQSITGEYDDLYGELPETISLSDLQTPPTQVQGEYNITYGPVQYILLTNLDTGDEQRFTLRSGETPLQPTSPGANYLMQIYDPVSGFSGGSTFVAPRPFAIDSRTSLSALPTVKPILQGTPSEPIGAGGLTQEQAHIVGADFGTIDSLLPGTNITDRQALISGLGSSPGSVNLNGVTGLLALDGTSEAVAIGGTSANGADLRAYVATGDVGLAIVNVAESTLPVLLGQIDLPGFAEDVAVVERLDLVAVALGDGGLAVVDVRDPLRPTVDAVYADLTVTQVIAVDDRLIIAQNGRVSLVDAASGVVLTSLGVGIGPDQQFEALAFEDGQIYALGDNGTLHVVSLENGTLDNRSVIDLTAELLDLPNSPQIATQDGILWIGSVGDGAGGSVRGGMVTIDATNPDTLVLVGDINTSNTASDFAGNSVAVTGSGFGVASHLRFDTGTTSESRLTVFDARDPSDNENQITEYRFAGQTKDIAIAAGEAFVATGTEGLQIVRFLGIDTQGVAPDITVSTLPEDVDDAVGGRQVFQGQTIRFDVDTDDDLQVRSVEVLINGNVILSTVNYPWDLTVTLPTIADLGTDQLAVQFRATDTGGNATITDAVALQMVADVTPFEILSISPDDGAALLPGAVRSVTVTFSKSVEGDTVNADTFVLAGPSGPIAPASISVRESGTQVQLTYPATAFGSGAYALTIDADQITDRAGTPLDAADITSDFSIQTVSGQTWISVTDGTWNDPLNWANGQTPAADDDIVLPLLDGVTATLSDLAENATSLNVSGDGIFEVKSSEDGTELTTVTLSNTGNIDVARGEVVVTTQTANSGKLVVSSAPGTTTTGQTFTFGGEIALNGTLTNTGTIEAREGGELILNTPSIINEGELLVTTSANTTVSSRIKTEGALTELTGGGTLRLDLASGTTRTASVEGSAGTANQGIIDERFINVDNLITGSGKIGVGFEFENAAAGRIEAQAGDFLRINTGRLDNDGVIEAQSGGTLLMKSDQVFFFGGLFGYVNGTEIDNDGGIIRADGGQVNFTNSSITGGVLETLNGGLMFIGTDIGNNFPTIKDLTLKGQLIVADFVRTEGTITNEGFLSTSTNGNFGSYIEVSENTVLTGGGSLNLFSTDVGDPENEVLSTIVNQSELLFDDETGEPLIDEFGQPIVEFETTLTLDNHNINGSGRIGYAGEEGEFDLQALFRISVTNGSSIDANQPGEILDFVNTAVTVIESSLSANAGILQFIDSDLYNYGSIDILEDGGFYAERSPFSSSNGGFIYNEGNINVFDGEFASDVFVFNRGDFNVFDGVASVSQMTDDIANGGRTYVANGQLTIQFGGTSAIDTGSGDAQIIVENSSNLAATLFEFEVGDSLHIADLDANNPVDVTFVGTGLTGTLTLDDGVSTVVLDLSTGFGDFTGVTSDDFIVGESDFGGIQVETFLDFG